MPPEVPPQSTLGPAPPGGRARRWSGLVLVALGLCLLTVGLVLLYVFAQRLAPPRPAAVIGPVPSPPAVVVPPVAPPTLVAPPPPPAPRSELPATFLAESPFAEDAASPLPVTAETPLWGPRDAPVTVTVFGDVESPHTRAALQALLAEKLSRGDDLRLAFRHFPLSQHRTGRAGALRLSALRTQQGAQAFWHALFELSRAVPAGDTSLDARLRELVPEPAEPLPSRAAQGLEADEQLGASLFVREIPALFINGARLDGFPTEPALAEVLDRELRAAHLTLAAGVPPARLYRVRAERNLVNLGEEPPARACVRPGDSPRRGVSEPLVTVVEFSDLECEHCRTGAAALREVVQRHPHELGVVFKHFPLPQHRLSRVAAGLALEARRVAGDRAFFGIVETVLTPGFVLDEEGLGLAARRAGLDPEVLLGPARQGAHDATLDRDIALAKRIGVTGAPTYFVNGRRLAGARSPAELESVVRAELSLAARVRSQGAGTVQGLACGERPGRTSGKGAAPFAPPLGAAR